MDVFSDTSVEHMTFAHDLELSCPCPGGPLFAPLLMQGWKERGKVLDLINRSPC